MERKPKNRRALNIKQKLIGTVSALLEQEKCYSLTESWIEVRDLLAIRINDDVVIGIICLLSGTMFHSFVCDQSGEVDIRLDFIF